MRIKKVRLIEAASMKHLDDLFDAHTGYGTIPNSESIDYFGYTVYMKPSEFLSLAAHATLKPKFYEKLLEEHEPIGYPMLVVDKDAYPDMLKIIGHEGRHRASAVQKMYGDNVLIPVHVFPQGYRNRHLTVEDYKKPFIPEKVDIGKKSMRDAYNTLVFFPPERIDPKSSHANVNKIQRKTNYKHPAALASEVAAAAVWESELNRTHSPASLKKENRNDDDVTEVLQDGNCPLKVYENKSPAPKGTALPRRCN